MTEPEAPKIEFPCDYPIKVLGRSSDAYQSIILDVFERHAPGFDRD
ncbi:MAG: YbeD family protein, partial [Halioglobus sp.]